MYSAFACRKMWWHALALNSNGWWQLEYFYFEHSHEAQKHSQKVTEQNRKHWFINKVYLLVGDQKFILKFRNYRTDT